MLPTKNQKIAFLTFQFLTESARGAANAKSQKQICAYLLDYTSKIPERERWYNEKDILKGVSFRVKIIDFLREAYPCGAIIGNKISYLDLVCANPKGYFLPCNAQEIIKYQNEMQQRADSAKTVVYFCDKALGAISKSKNQTQHNLF
jgi:hypothetical protein